jgi:hypothetical protein
LADPRKLFTGRFALSNGPPPILGLGNQLRLLRAIDAGGDMGQELAPSAGYLYVAVAAIAIRQGGAMGSGVPRQGEFDVGFDMQIGQVSQVHGISSG